MRLQHTVLPAEVTLAESAVTDDALRLVLALLEVAANALGCTATDREGHVNGALTGDVVCREWCRLRGEVLSGKDETELRLGHVGSKSEERAEVANRGRLWDGDWEGCAAVSLLSPDAD